MAEYKSFHYLMHKVDDPVKAVYVTGPKPLTFDELYSPREDRFKQIYKGEFISLFDPYDLLLQSIDITTRLTGEKQKFLTVLL